MPLHEPLSVLRRSPFIPGGRVVARRTVTLDGTSYAPGEDVKVPLDARLLRVLWEQFQVDTIEREVPDPKAKKPKAKD